VSLLLGLYCYTYSSFAIVARAALDRCSAAMIPYAINFLVFTLGALLAPAYGWLLNDLAGGGKLTENRVPATPIPLASRASCWRS